MSVQTIQIEGASAGHLTPFKRNKCARGLDYVGYIPVVGSVSGVARLIAGIAAMIFFSIEASKADGTDKEKLLMYRTVAGHEALRGFLEITWICNAIAALFHESQVDSDLGTLNRSVTSLSDPEYAEQQRNKEPIAGIISLDSCIAYGDYIYQDNNPRFNAVHYSYKKYDNNQVVWTTVTPKKGMYNGIYGTYGSVLKKEYTAEPAGAATFTVQRNAE